MRFISYTDRKAVAAALRPIYTAPTGDGRRAGAGHLRGPQWGKKYPATVRVWRDAWERFIPFLEFPPEVRKIIYTTNSIESLNYQLRKIIKNRGHFPNDDAVVKLLWLAIRDIEDKRARERAKRGRPTQRPAPQSTGQTGRGRHRAGLERRPSARSASPSPAGSRWPCDRRPARRGSSTPANTAGAQPRSTRRHPETWRPGLTAASTGTPSTAEEPRPTHKIKPVYTENLTTSTARQHQQLLERLQVLCHISEPDPEDRRTLIERYDEAAAATGVARRTLQRQMARLAASGPAGLVDVRKTRDARRSVDPCWDTICV